MHAPNITQSDPTNPYIQIMFNINSKNVVNNNIVGQRQKEIGLQGIKQKGGDEKCGNIDRRMTNDNNKAKMNKSAMAKGNTTMMNTTRYDPNQLQNTTCKPKKKHTAKSNNHKFNLTGSQTHRSSKQTVHKKHTSQGFSKLNPSQQAALSQKKYLNHKSKPKLKSVTPNSHNSNMHKDTRQKIIELMIKDYERGQITADNFKQAISSLIQRQAYQKRLSLKTNTKSQKPRTRIATSYKNSLAASLHTTPKHKPSKSKSQKFHSYQPSMVLKIKQCSQEPQIIERVIHNKDFMSKIVIKGINSSLFLSNEWTDKESPIKDSQKVGEVSVNVINTSDSVRDLKKGMREVMVENKDEKDREIYSQMIGGLSKLNQQKQKETRNILANFIDEIKGSSRNEFISSGQTLRRQNSVTSSQNSLKYLTRLKENVKYDQNFEDQPDAQEQGHPNSLDQFYVREQGNSERSSQSKVSRIEQLQRQYALLLKDKQSESRNESSLPNQSVEHFNPGHQAREQQQVSYSKIKSYLSSQLENKLQQSGPLSQAKQQMNQKRVKSITQSEIKKLNHIMDVIKDQLTKKQSTSTNETKDSEVLQRIVSLLESQKTKVQQELKLYEQKKGESLGSSFVGGDKRHCMQQGSQYEGRESRIEQNQIINSFQKKLKKLNNLQHNNTIAGLQQNNNLKIYYQSSDIKSSSSRKSLSSNHSHHLQKVKISQLNLDQIQLGLRKRLNDLQDQRQHQYSIITEKFINDKITPKQYQEEKEIIEKWFEVESRELRRTKRNLLEGYKKAQQFITKNELKYETKLSKEKSTKMIKCISEKYLNSNNINKEVQNQGGINKTEYDQQQKPKRLKKYVQQKPTNTNNNFSHLLPSKPYSTIQQLQQDLLIRNITPIQKFLLVQKQQRQLDALSPLSIQESGISQEISNNTQNNSHDMPEMLMTLQECDNSEGSKEYVIRNKKNESKAKDNHRQQEQSATYQYEQVKSKRPYSAKIHSEIAQYLKKYEQSPGSSDEKLSKPKESSIDDNNDQNHSSSNSNTEYLQQYGDNDNDEADNQESSNEQYYGYNDTQEGSVDIDKTIRNINKQSPQPNQQSLTSSQGLILQQHPQPTIIINKPSSLHQDQIFSPKKPIIHQQFSEQLLQYNSTDADHQKVSLQFTQLNKEFNQTYLKLKYLTEQDKDDIFEFMFLDLCLELFLEQTKNNRIMKSIERFLVWQRKKKKIPKGFKTGLDTCKLYISHIQEYLLKNHLIVLKRLQSPMGPSAKQMLKFMRDYDDIDDSSQSQIQTINLVLPIEIYQKFQSQPVNKLQVQRYYDDEQKQQSRLKFLKSLKHFHNKAMFDSLNEMLDVQRCYGIWGKPFPWKKALDVDRKFTQDEIKVKLKHASQKLIQNCSYFCGVLVDKEESVFGKSNVSEQYLHHIREDRMSKMLSNDMIDNEDRWIFYDDEETEVLVSLAKTITADLISEVLQEVKVISWK